METEYETTFEKIKVSKLKPHPRNYNTHPPDQLEHIKASLKTTGVYRNIVIAKDNTILAGHGVVEAAKELGLDEIRVGRVDLDPKQPEALSILVGDNEISHLSIKDDRTLTENLKDIFDNAEKKLLGTGYTDAMLANLVMITRPSDEIEDFNAAAEWVGMPEYENPEATIKLTISFKNMEDRAECLQKLGIELSEQTASTWYPVKKKTTSQPADSSTTPESES